MKKIGVWTPSRKELVKFTAERPGIFLEPVASGIKKALEGRYELIDNQDFRNAVVIDGSVVLPQTGVEELDGFLWFSHINKDSDGHDIMVLEQMEKHCPVVNSPFGLRIGLDKFKTSSFLGSKGVKVPSFALIPRGEEETVNSIVEKWCDVLVKPRFGGFGIGIYRSKSAQEVIDLMDYSGGQTFYVEKYYENDFNDWCGINVVGGKVLYGYGKKQSKISGWKILDRKEQGGEMVLRKPSAEQEEIALKVAEVTGLGFFGVDIINTNEGGNLVVDLNTFPGIYPEMLNEAGVDVGKRFLEMLSEKVGD